MNNVKELRKSNKTLIKSLTKLNKEQLFDMMNYLRSSDIYEPQLEEVLQDLLYIFIDAQHQKEDIQQRIGPNYKEFCDQIIENTPRKTALEKIIKSLQFFSILVILFIVIHVFYEFCYSRFFTTFQLPKYIEFTSYNILYTILIFAISSIYRRYNIACSLSSVHSKRSNGRLKFALLACLTCAIAVLLLNILPILKASVPTHIVMILLLLLILFYAISCCILKHLYHKHVQMTKTLSS